MSLVPYFVIGLVQGILEWIPVSSEGVLVLILPMLFNEEIVSNFITIAVWMHLGTTASVIVYYREEWKKIILNWQENVVERTVIVWATIGTAITGLPIRLLLKGYIESNPASSAFVYLLIGFALLMTSGLLFYSNNINKTKLGNETIQLKGLEDFSKSKLLIIGLIHGFAIIPGISRSGLSVSSFLLFKARGEESFKGSFLISVPAVIGATIVEILLLFVREGPIQQFNFVGLGFAIVIAFIFGLLTIKILLEFARRFNFTALTFIFGIIVIIGGIFLF
jgi:undecaprenyl-diphosphatase